MNVPETVLIGPKPDDALDDRPGPSPPPPLVAQPPPLPSALPAKPAPAAPAPPAKRLYRVAGGRWVTRDIAALDFLLNIPLQAEPTIVQTGYLQQTKQEAEFESGSSDDNSEGRYRARAVPTERYAPQHPAHAHQHHHHLHRSHAAAPAAPGEPQGKWWDKWISHSLLAHRGPRRGGGGGDGPSSEMLQQHVLLLEGPTLQDQQRQLRQRTTAGPGGGPLISAYTPGRRLEGDDALRVQIPLGAGGSAITKQRSVARVAALREWERRTAHGVRGGPTPQPPLLDGRLFFSASGSYPVSVFSLVRYEPRREEAQLRRQKLEARGGGGSQFSIPSRGDWRGISYRSLLPRREHREQDKRHRAFNRFLLRKNAETVVDEENETDYDSDDTSLSSEDSNEYVPGILDDPDMVLGRHRNVMVGDRVIGPIIASTIQFVEPALLKADLNKQFRERFDGWEPSKSALKYIGAKVVNGNYVLTDPVLEETEEEPVLPPKRKRQSSTASSAASEHHSEGHPEKPATEKQIRMPPSLTLSKIRSLKHQALQVAVKADFEIGTLSLACVYFERLCLDCRVDKSNRRITFAACLLLASKLNEPNVGLVMQSSAAPNNSGDGITNRLTALVRPNHRSTTMFASLLEFFTQEWEIGLKQLFEAEWGVFAALGFNLHAQPSQVAFHFKRFMKTLERSPKNYLGDEMYGYWQETLEQEEDRRRAIERRKARLKQRKEEELLNLHIEIEHDLLRRKNKATSDESNKHDTFSDMERGDGNEREASAKGDAMASIKVTRRSTGIKIFQRLGMRRIMSAERLASQPVTDYAHSHSLPLHGSLSSASLPAMAESTGNNNHHHHSLLGLSDSAEAAMEAPVVDLESGLMETFSIDSVAGSEKESLDRLQSPD